MGRSSTGSSGRRDKEEDSKSKDDRLLQQAKDYVARQETRAKKRKQSSNSSTEESNGSSSSSDEDDERRGKKRSKKSTKSTKKHDRKHKKHKSKKKHKKSSKKSHKKDRKEAKAPPPKVMQMDRSKLYPMGEVRGSPPTTLLDADEDYFAYHSHFVVYLYRNLSQSFGDLTTEQARKAFIKFCTAYNSGSLESKYYNPLIPQEAIDEAKPTRHIWAFQTSKTESQHLAQIEAGVRKQTQYEASSSSSAKNEINSLPQRATCMPVNPAAAINQQDRRATTDRAAHRRLKQHVRTAEEEFSFAGSSDARARQLQKKQAVSNKIHGAARDKEDSNPTISGADMYGDSEKSSFQSALSREKQRKANRQEQRSQRIGELQQKEQDRQAAMFEALGIKGIKPGQKITIAPRKDGE